MGKIGSALSGEFPGNNKQHKIINNMAEKEKRKWMYLAERLIAQAAKFKSEYDCETLKQEFVAFVDYYTTHPSSYYQRTKQKQRGADKRTADYEFSGDRIDRAAPMTITAFCAWLGKSHNWFQQSIAELKRKKNPSDDDKNRLEFMVQLQTFFRAQLLEGAIVGDYNTAMVQGLLQLRNNIDITTGGKSAAPIISIVEDKSSRADYDAANGSEANAEADLNGEAGAGIEFNE